MDITLTLIQSKIYEVRGQKVMLDFDLAEMYQVEDTYLKSIGKAESEPLSRRLYVSTNK